MLRNIRILLIIAILLLTLIPTSKNQHGSEKALLDVDTIEVSIPPEFQDHSKSDTIFLKSDGEDEAKYFLVKVRIQVKPVNVILLLDQSLGMDICDIEDFHGFKSKCRIDVERNISQQIFESIENPSETTLILFGGNKIRECTFERDREILENILEDMHPEEKNNYGLYWFESACSLARESESHCFVVFLTGGGIEREEGSKLINYIKSIETSRITIYAATIGRVDCELEVNQIADMTNGDFISIIEERKIEDFIELFEGKMDEYGLEDVELQLKDPTGAHLDEFSVLEGTEPEKENGSLYWEKIRYKEPVILELKIGIEDDEIRKYISPFNVTFDISYRSFLEDLDVPSEELSFSVANIRYREENGIEYIVRKIFEYSEAHEWLKFLAVIIILIILCLIYLTKRKRIQRRTREKLNYYIKRGYKSMKRNDIESLRSFEEAYKILEDEIEIIRERLSKKLEYNISQADGLEKQRDYESALPHLETAIPICKALKDNQEKGLINKYKELKILISDLRQEKESIKELSHTITNLVKKFKEKISEEELQNKLEESEVLEEWMEPHVSTEEFHKNVSQKLEKNNLDEIGKMHQKLEELQKVLVDNIVEIM